MIQTPEAAPEADGEACGQHSRGRGCGPGDADRLDQVTSLMWLVSTVIMVTHKAAQKMKV